MRKTADKIKKIEIGKLKPCHSTLKGRNFSLLEEQLNIRVAVQKFFKGFSFYNVSSLAFAPSMSEVLIEIQTAFSKGVYPETNIGGTSESYLLKDSNGFPIAIFKPSSAHWGSDARKEIAAYQLDYDHFANVPPTVLATFSHPYFKGEPKFLQGSCQWYVWDASNVLYLQQKQISSIPAQCVRRLAILDIRLINPDRHTSNVLYRNLGNKVDLFPIDHGAILPENLFGASYAWLNWDQAKLPFDKEELDYISHLDPLKDAKLLLDELKISIGGIKNMIAASLLLKEGAGCGLSAFEIGRLISRQYVKDEEGKKSWKHSMLEILIQKIEKDFSIQQFVLEVNRHINELKKEYFFINEHASSDQ